MAAYEQPTDELEVGSGGRTPAAVAEPPLFAAGRRIGGRYVLELRLGHGGMAVVWLATDERLGRPVAIKVLSDTLSADHDYLGRFAREAKLAAAPVPLSIAPNQTALAVDPAGAITLSYRARGGQPPYEMGPSAEIEGILLEHPAVAQVAVVPRADPVMGEIGVAVVVPRDGAAPPDLDDLRAHAAPRLAAYKLPEAVLVRDDLPLTTMDKLDRKSLIEQAAGDGGSDGLRP